jgi:SAM-dependent methyltransferase
MPVISTIISSLPIFSFGDQGTALFGHPYALARTSLRLSLKQIAEAAIAGEILDVGCGSMPYRAIFLNVSSYHGLEIDQPRNRANPLVTHFYDGTTFPQDAESYTCVICSQVLEHCFSPENLLAEIHRVLKPEGVLLLTIPFIWPEHEQPYDSQRFTSFGLKDRLHRAGFEILQIRKTNPGLAALLQLSIEWVESGVRPHLKGRKEKLWRLASAIPYTAFNLIGVAYRNLPWVRDNSEKAELYLDLVVLARKPTSAPAT